MSLLGRLLGRQDPRLKRAQDLARISRLSAIPMKMALADEFPALFGVASEEWDFFVTVAGVFLATSRLGQTGLTEKQQQPLLDAIENGLMEWDRSGARAFEDCKTLFEREYDRLAAKKHAPRFLASDALGLWVFWNLFKRPPQDDGEAKLLRGIGVSVVGTMINYWN